MDDLEIWVAIIKQEARLDAFESFFWEMVKMTEGDVIADKYQKKYNAYYHFFLSRTVDAQFADEDFRAQLNDRLKATLGKLEFLLQDKSS